MNGHWFCDRCDDVVTLPLPYGRWDVRHGVKCPVCRHMTANWINHASEEHKRVNADFAAEKFTEMRKAIE